MHYIGNRVPFETQLETSLSLSLLYSAFFTSPPYSMFAFSLLISHSVSLTETPLDQWESRVWQAPALPLQQTRSEHQEKLEGSQINPQISAATMNRFP
jgi:hypothetical protein